MSENHDTPTKLPPTAFAQTIAQALADRHTEKGQSVKSGTPGTGVRELLVQEVSTPRDPDETHEQWQVRHFMAMRDALKWCLVLNDENYRDELLREALQEIRNPEPVTT